MKLRSSRVLKRGKPNITSNLQNQDSSDGKRLCLRSHKSNFGKKGASKTEIGVYVDNCDDNCDDNLEMGMKETLNTDDKGLYLGSEVLDPIKDLGVNCPKEEIEEESVERVQAEEGNGLMSVNLSETGSGFREEIQSPHDDYENGSENLESKIFFDDRMVVSGDDDDKETLLNDLENSNLLGKRKGKKGNSRRGRKKKNVGNLQIDVVSDVNGDDSECKLMNLEHKRGRKRKNMGSQSKRDRRAKKEKVEKNGIRVRERVLRSRTMTIVSAGVPAVDGGRRMVVLGLKRESVLQSRTMTTVSGGVAAVDDGRRKVVLGLKREDETPKKQLKLLGRPPKVQMEDRKSRPKKKLERRGRPRKVLKKDGSLIEIPMKTLKRRGRPPKVSHEIPAGPMKSQGIRQKLYRKDMIFKKLKRRGRPPKTEARALATCVIKMRTVKLVAVKKRPKIQKKNGLSEVTRVKIEENSGQMMLEGEAHNVGKGIVGKKMNRKMLKQLVRDKIENILLKSGWTIDLRQRPERSYNYAVYVEPNGRNNHWSTTGAYAKLKKKIENGDADSNEISAFTPIPEEEISMLFRHHDKERRNKKKKKIVKNVNRGKIVIDKKKQPGKKSKDGSKRKMIFKTRGKDIITKSRKPSLLARGSNKGLKQDNVGGLVNKKRNLLSWMIDSGVILAGCKVQYGKTRRQKRSCEGTITNEGICCSCCNEIMGLSEFVGHFRGKISQCFDDIYLDSGTCLRKCLMESWRKEELSINRSDVVDVQGDDPNDDTCNICGDGGNLICCDGCPSTFHQSCLDIQNLPSGDWNCIYCSCKFCGVVSVTTPQVEDSHDAINSQMFSCCLCEEKFHQWCLQEVEDVNIDSNRQPFCGRKCQEVFVRLQTYVGVKHELEDGFSWTLLQCSDIGQDATVHDTLLKVENNSKLAVAFSVMDECFMPIVDDRSGTNIIHSVVYNRSSNFKRLNYAGFLTAVLEKGDEFITAASIRIHGYRLAEMPFIGTRHMYRRQGMCRRLLDVIESTLSSLGVEELIIPAIPTLLQTWTKVFGFTPLEELKKQAMKYMSVMMFPGIDILRKPLLQNQSADIDHSPCADYKEQPSDAAGFRNNVIDYELKEETCVLVDVGCCPEPNDENNSQFETTSSNATDCKQMPADTTGVGNAAIDNDQTEEATLGENVSNAAGVRNAAIDSDQTEEATVGENVTNAAGVGKDDIDYKQTEKETVLMDSCSCPNLENDKLAISQGVDSLCDLNFNVLPCETDGQTCVDSKSFLDCTIELNSTDSAICGNHQSPEPKLELKDDGVSVVKAKPCPLTSNLVLKNTFDLNLRPTAVETNMHIVSNDSVQCEPPVNLIPEPLKVNLS